MKANGTKSPVAWTACAALAVIGVAGVGCGSKEASSAEEELLGKGGQPVIGGAATTGDPAVVQMRAYYSGSYGSCTGTLIAPDVVLTAAHCIEDSPQSVKVYFGTYANSAAASEWRSVKSWQSHPQYPHRYINEGHDCAVLVLDQAVTGVAPKPYRKTPLTTAAIGSAARIVGFGHTNGYAQTGGGTKRSLDTTIKEVSGGVLSIGGLGATSCQGDSGGPAFMMVDGVETVAGISSYGVQNCVGLGSYSRTELCAPWIDTFVTSSGGSSGGGSSGGSSSGSSGSSSGSSGGSSSGGSSSSGSSSGGTDACVEREPNDQFMSANAICKSITGTLSSSTDSDAFTFTATPGTTYDIALTAPPSVNIGLYRVTPSGFDYIGVGDDQADGSRRITRTTSVGGTYYLSVYRYQVGSAPGESWQLRISLDAP